MRRSMLFEAVLVLLIIALLSVLYAAISSSPGSEGGLSEGWTVSGIIAAPPTRFFVSEDSFGNMFTGENGTLYTVDGKHIHAIDHSGSRLWSLEIPDRYRLSSYGNGSGTRTYTSDQRKRTYTEEIINDVVVVSDQPWSSNSAVVKDGNLYVVLKREEPVIITGVLLSVSSNGSIRWNIPFGGGWTGKYRYQYGLGTPEGVILHNDVLHVYSATGGVSLISLNGSIFGYIGNVNGKPAIGEDGTLYVRNDSHWSPPGQLNNSALFLDAYRADGTLIWRHSYGEFGINETMMAVSMLENQPYLRNGTLYAWSNDGIVALDLNGSLRFRYHIPEGLLLGCGFDQNDTLYLSYSTDDTFPFSYNHSGAVIMRPDGTVEKSQSSGDPGYFFHGLHEFPDGMLYQARMVMPSENNGTSEIDPYKYTTYNDGLLLEYLKNHSGRWDFPRGLKDLDTCYITALDLATGEQAWSYRLPLDPHSVTLGPENAGKVTADGMRIEDINYVSRDEWYSLYGIPRGSTGIRSNSWAFLTIVNGTMYVNTWSYNYEYPPFYGKSRCVYSGGVYAFNLNGTLNWSISTDSRVVSVHEVNGTIYYGTGGGKVSAVRTGVIAGMLTAAASVVYLFLRFFPFGTVTRSRARLEKNSNRNKILQYIRDKPGLSLFDIAEGLAMNPGTVRYHLMILGLNHRIISFKADEKFVRYFVNSGTYGQGDQLVFSLMRREPLRRIISQLREQPGLSNLELSKALDVHESSTMRNLKLLVEKGVVARSLLPDGKIVYSLSSEYIVQRVTAFEGMNA